MYTPVVIHEVHTAKELEVPAQLPTAQGVQELDLMNEPALLEDHSNVSNFNQICEKAKKLTM